MQRIRQAEKEMIYDEFKDRAGEIVSGTVRRFERSDVIVDLGKFEAIMPNRERVQTEDYNIGDRIRAYVVAVENGARGPEIILSRSHPNFVRRLFETEVSEITDRTVEIKGIAREAGYRTKIAVFSANDKVDPVGACVGMRGARVKNIVRELNNEKVDIIRWSADVKEFVLEALKPAKVKSVTLDEAKKGDPHQGRRRPAFARHRQARPECAAHLPADRLGHQHREGQVGRGRFRRTSRQRPPQRSPPPCRVDRSDGDRSWSRRGLNSARDASPTVEPQDIADAHRRSTLEAATEIHAAAKRATRNTWPPRSRP